MNEYEESDYSLKHKSIDLKMIHDIIEKNKKPSTKPTIRRVSQSLTLKYNITSRLSKEKVKTIHDLIKEYYSFSEGDELRHTYMLKFNELSGKLSLYKDKIFLDFLREQFENSNNKYIILECSFILKHIILECSFILHKLIIAAKKEREGSFLQYINKTYFPLFKKEHRIIK